MADRDPRYFDESEPEVRPRAVRRKRVRMAQTVKSLGGRASANPAGVNTASVVAQRARAEKAKAIEKAGHNKGEKKGYGAASGKTEFPDNIMEGLEE